jgi:hypothetical protein
MLIVAVRVPSAAGVKVTLILQLAPAATLEPQVFVAVKSVAFVPVTAILLRVSGAVPVLLSVTLWVLLVPTG